MAQASPNPSTRRASQDRAPAAATALALGATAAHAGGADPRVAELLRQADAHEADTARMNAGDHTQAEWDAFAVRDNQFLAKVQATPETPAYAAIRARAIRMLHSDNSELFAGDDATFDLRLAAQLVRSLA